VSVEGIEIDGASDDNRANIRMKVLAPDRVHLTFALDQEMSLSRALQIIAMLEADEDPKAPKLAFRKREASDDR
jgi:hypothetical protein